MPPGAAGPVPKRAADRGVLQQYPLAAKVRQWTMAAQQVPSLPEAGDVIHLCRRQDRECGACLSHGRSAP